MCVCVWGGVILILCCCCFYVCVWCEYVCMHMCAHGLVCFLVSLFINVQMCDFFLYVCMCMWVGAGGGGGVKWQHESLFLIFPSIPVIDCHS